MAHGFRQRAHPDILFILWPDGREGASERKWQRMSLELDEYQIYLGAKSFTEKPEQTDLSKPIDLHADADAYAAMSREERRGALKNPFAEVEARPESAIVLYGSGKFRTSSAVRVVSKEGDDAEYDQRIVNCRVTLSNGAADGYGDLYVYERDLTSPMYVDGEAVDSISMTLHVEEPQLRRLVDDIKATGKKPTLSVSILARMFGNVSQTGFILEKQPGSTYAVLLGVSFELPGLDPPEVIEDIFADPQADAREARAKLQAEKDEVSRRWMLLTWGVWAVAGAILASTFFR